MLEKELPALGEVEQLATSEPGEAGRGEDERRGEAGGVIVPTISDPRGGDWMTAAKDVARRSRTTWAWAAARRLVGLTYAVVC